MSPWYWCSACFVLFCVFVLGWPFCHGTLKLDMSTLLTTFFVEHHFNLYQRFRQPESATIRKTREIKFPLKRKGCQVVSVLIVLLDIWELFLVLSKSITCTKTLMTHHAVFLTVITLTCFRKTSALTVGWWSEMQ